MSLIVKIIITIELIVIIALCGALINEYYLIHHLSKNVYSFRIYEIIQSLITIGIGLSIPFLIKKFIDNSKSVKEILVGYCKDIHAQLKTISDKILELHNLQQIPQVKKDEIIIMVESVEKEVNFLKRNILINYRNNRINTQLNAISDSYIAFWEIVTGDNGILNQNFAFNNAFYSNFNEAISNLKEKISLLIFSVHKL